MTVYLSAGEPSGDRWGAQLAEALRRRDPEVRLYGMVGPRMRAAGVGGFSPPTGATGLAGFLAPIVSAPRIVYAFGVASGILDAAKLDVAVVIDYPGFHMRLLRWIAARDVPAVYWLPPQVWAWRPNRARTVARRTARVVTAFPWEREFYAPHMPAERVLWPGHPLIDEIPPISVTSRAGGPIALLPGSRRSEVTRIAPIMARAAEMLGTEAIFALHAPEAADWVRDVVGKDARIVVGLTPAVLARASAAIVCAGTATLEAACAGMPTIVVWRGDPVTHAIARRLVRTRWIGLPNILLERNAYPELVQSALAPSPLADTVRAVMAAPPERWIAFAREVRERLGPPGVADRVAEIVLGAAGRTPA